MPRLVNQSIEPPTLDAQRRPLAYRWRRQSYRIARVLDSWREIGQWWEGEPETETYRCELIGGGMVELTTDLQGNWRLYAIYD